MSEPVTPPMPVRPSRWSVWLLSAACLLALVGLGVSLIHFIRPTPLFFALFMTVGQGSFGLAMLLYVIVIVKDLRRRKVL